MVCCWCMAVVDLVLVVAGGRLWPRHARVSRCTAPWLEGATVHSACNPLALHALQTLPFHSHLVLRDWHRVQAVVQARFLVVPSVSADKFVVSPGHSTSNVTHHCSQLPSWLPLLVFLAAWEKQSASTTNYVLHSTTINSIFLQAMKGTISICKSSSGCSLAYRLFIPAYMITPKVICDDTYSKQHLFIRTGVHMIYPNPSHNKLIPTIFIPTTTVHGRNEIQRIEEAQIDLLVWHLSHCHPN